jgi:hypothetical protein
MSPDRWTIIHSLLGLVSRYAMLVKTRFPSSIEIDDRWENTGMYPRIRIIRDDAEDMLLDSIATHICTAVFPQLQVARQPKSIQDAVFRYIRQFDLSSEEIGKVEQGSLWSDAKDVLLLVRGLIAGGVLRFALGSKRWRVNYGLDPNRSPQTKLAVPYRSKDSPSPRSEFSHPDVVLILTSLTYYYSGLTDEDLFDTFAHLLKSGEADNEYGEWVRTAGSLPDAFRRLVGVNIKDRHQCTTGIFPRLRYSKNAIDYYLAHIVFPKEMKEFPYKLSASGWDIGAAKVHPTTGFSGTNDSRHVLPLSMHHLDLPEQKHTNALVLSYILQDENSVRLLPPRSSSESSDAESFLNIVNQMEAPTRVVLDVGAQILEMSNYQVAEAWLKMSNPSTTKAAVFFNDNEELTVLDRHDHTEPLQTSAFAKQLGDCLVYLDEAHTRGIDLKLPTSYRAAVTLGTNLTKDRLVQACMRMRKLGKGQSVVFCIPEEIQVKILGCTAKLQASDIAVSDVLTWAISETWADLRRCMPLWATQGRRFEDHKGLLKDNKLTVGQAHLFLEDEAQGIETRYRPRSHSMSNVLQGWDISNANIAQILQRCNDFNAMNFNSATLQEEQERELSPEIEEERQVQRPAPMDHARHELHHHLLRFVDTGILTINSDCFVPAFEALRSTSAGKHCNIPEIPATLFVTADFNRTVKQPSHDASGNFVSDSYLRPVQWVLSVITKSPALNMRLLVVISPFEANNLVPRLRGSKLATLHLYSPRSNLAYKPLDALDLYYIGAPHNWLSISRSDILQLNLFAGQLYFDSYSEYKELCEYLGLAWKATEEGETVQPDGFVLPAKGKWHLKESPVRFFRELVKILRDGEASQKSHIARVFAGEMLEEDDFKKTVEKCSDIKRVEEDSDIEMGEGSDVSTSEESDMSISDGSDIEMEGC